MTMRPTLVLAMLLSAAVATGALTTGSEPLVVVDGPRALEARGLRATPTARPTLSAAGDRFSVGSERRYHATAKHRVDLTGEDGDASAIAVDVDGVWTLTVVETGEAEVVVRGVLAGEVATGSDGRVARNAALSAELARPHYLVYATSGALERVEVDPSTSDVGGGLVRALAASTQLVWPNAGAVAWESRETDATGAYVAGYRRDGDDVLRTKLRYEGLAGGVDGDVAVTATTSYHLDAAGSPDAIDAREELAVSAGGIQVASRSTTVLALEGTRVVAVEAIDRAGLVAVGASAGAASGPADDRRIVAGATLPDLLAELAASDDDHTMTDVAHRLEALLRLEPDVADDVAAQLHAPPDDRTASVLLGALGNAGTKAAQAALVDTLGAADLASGVRADAAIAMTLVEEPGHDVTAALTRSLDADAAELRSASGLALGTIARRLPATDAARRRAIVDELLARLSAATAPAVQAVLLAALGNTADPRALPAIRAALASPTVRVRRTAVEALRSIDDASVDGLIAGVLAADAEAVVRKGAVFAAGFRLPRMNDALARTAASDPDERVRAEAKRVLAGASS
jgi:HEAT repeat protein